MVGRYPPILLHDLADLEAKMRFLQQVIKRPAGLQRMGGKSAGIWGGVVSYPRYFTVDLANYTGRRARLHK